MTPQQAGIYLVLYICSTCRRHGLAISLSIRATARRITGEDAQSVLTCGGTAGMSALPTNGRMLDTAVLSKAGQQDQSTQKI